MKYELLYVVSGVFSDTEIESVSKKVAEMIEGAAGKVLKEKSLGKIKLAYPIKKQRHGTYILVHFEMEPTSVQTLDQKLRLTDEVLRHTILSLVPAAAETDYEISSYVAPLTAEGRQASKEKPEVTPKPVAVAPPPPSKTEETSPKMSVEELDKKLDEILESDVLKDI